MYATFFYYYCYIFLKYYVDTLCSMFCIRFLGGVDLKMRSTSRHGVGDFSEVSFSTF